MKTFAWINTDTNAVENMISYDGETPIQLPANVQLVEIPSEGIAGSWSMLSGGTGWSYIDGQFVEPEMPAPPPSPQPQVIGGAPNVIA